MKTVQRWKFLRLKDKKIVSDNGDCTWKTGEKKVFDGQISLCHAGFHCSKEINQAFSFVQGEVLAQVECSGKHLEEDDKEVWQEMKIIKAWKWQKKDSVALSIYAAELCLENFEKVFPDDKRPRKAIEAARKWLEKPTKKNQDAAWRAAWSAASAAESAAWSAASTLESAERSAAWSAAWSAASTAESAESAAWRAESAAWRAAWSAASAERKLIIKKIGTWMKSRVKELEQI